MKGRKPKPSVIKQMEGNRSKIARADMAHDLDAPGKPRLPDHLTAAERQIWLDVVAALPPSLLRLADESILERFAVSYARWRDIQRIIVKSGLLVQSPQGPIRNPLLVVQKEAARDMHLAGEVMGLSPVARARLASKDNDGDEDPMALLLGMDGDPAGAWATPPRRKDN
jgi:P27 family predicted phage terminase small subunit